MLTPSERIKMIAKALEGHKTGDLEGHKTGDWEIIKKVLEHEKKALENELEREREE